MVESLDWDKIIAEIDEEILNLQRMKVWALRRKDQGESGPLPQSTAIVTTPSAYPLPTRFPRLIPSDAFFRMSVPEAITKYLNMVKGPRSAKEITQALKEGGFTSKAQNLYATVFPTLMRMKKAGVVDKVSGSNWGLVAWYTSGRKADKVSEGGDES